MKPVARARIAPEYTISRLIKGGWQLARGHGSAAPDDPLSDMDRFVDAGITTFDCADIYTGVEELIGEWLRRRARRGSADDVQIHTKYVPDLDRLPAHSRADVERGVDRSLRRLGIERLDLVQLHWWDYDIRGYVEAAGWLDEMRRAGKVRHVGLTNFDRLRLAEIVDAGISIVSHQVQYSVLDRRPADDMAAYCAERGIALLCYGSLAGGFLSSRYLGQQAPAPPFENRSLLKYRLIIDEFGGWDRFQQMLSTLEGVAARHGTSIGTAAVRWVLDEPGVAGVIVGARHARHLDALVQIGALTLGVEDRAAIGCVQDGSAGPRGAVYALERVKGGRHAAVMRYSLNRDAAAPPYHSS
jgi:aryl-alcohol dehydrogenase-like predicted oxidoreductase